MPTLFSRIIDGEIPGRFVWCDTRCVVFLDVSPVTPGHALVVPREEVDHWIDASPELLAHLHEVAREIGAAQLAAFGGERAGLVIAGYGVPHLHLHVFPTSDMAPFANLDGAPADEDDLDAAARALRSALVERGHHDVVEASLLASAR
ncbi:diadenosine tetraphosphate (Ap4A) HIT family hydrolase [Salana multivorans]|uniref:Diadenosine tetraphosphate (Ap4A) HIT family hydrolase n=1 Tax=Salana multivorans TaxID=120377 RepID=A0A3N2D1H5_9MICO|nr:HIT family protein [Salana multivorans]ROR93640.1 diadenosine tetraphosphate (Ap4A) HIT family hydrolase [Salana multivorans]